MTSLIVLRTETLSGNPHYDVTCSLWELRRYYLRNLRYDATPMLVFFVQNIWSLCVKKAFVWLVFGVRIIFRSYRFLDDEGVVRDEMTFTNISLLFVARQNIFDPFVSIHLNEYRKTELARSHDYIITWRTQAIMHRFLSPKALKLKIWKYCQWAIEYSPNTMKNLHVPSCKLRFMQGLLARSSNNDQPHSIIAHHMLYR